MHGVDSEGVIVSRKVEVSGKNYYYGTRIAKKSMISSVGNSVENLFPIDITLTTPRCEQQRTLIGSLIKAIISCNPTNNFCGLSLDRTHHVVQNRTMGVKTVHPVRFHIRRPFHR